MQKNRLRLRVVNATAMLIAAVAAGVSASVANAQSAAASRPAVKGCQWERAASQTVGLAAWVQRCDYGHRKIQLLYKGNALVQQYSDGGTADAVIEVFDLLPAETIENGVLRLYRARTKADTASKCVVKAYAEGKAAPGSVRYEMVPNAQYARVVKAQANPNEVPEPPCGVWGTSADGIQYFQAWPRSDVRKVLFVRVGQDEPLFDELTLQLIPAAPKKP